MGRFFYILCEAKGRYKKFNQFSKNFFMLKPFKSTCIHRSQFIEFASKLKSHLQHLRFIKFSIQFSDMLLVERRNMIGLFLNNEIILDGNSQFFFFFVNLWEVNVQIKIYLFASWRLSRECWWKVLFVEVMRWRFRHQLIQMLMSAIK